MEDLLKAFEFAQKQFDASEAVAFDDWERLKAPNQKSDLAESCNINDPVKPKVRDVNKTKQLRKSRRRDNLAVAFHSLRNFKQLRKRAAQINLSFLDAVSHYTFNGNIVIEARKDALSTANRAGSVESSEHFVLWTDGSTITSRSKIVSSGAAVVYKPVGNNNTWIERAYHIPKLHDSARAEFIAISEALDIALAAMCNESVHFAEVHIFSDALAVLESISRFCGSCLPRKRLKNDIVLGQFITRSQCLYQSKIDVHLHWVPGHSGVAGNVRADHAAGQAARRPQSCLYQWQKHSMELEESYVERATSNRNSGMLDLGNESKNLAEY